MSRIKPVGKTFLFFFRSGLIGLLIFLLGCAGSVAETTHPESERTEDPASEAHSNTETSSIRYAVFPAPPYMIDAGTEDTAISGIDVEIVQEIARRMGLKVDYVRCTWERCLELMKAGDVDILSSAYKKPEREAYMLYLDQPFLDRLPIAFYYLRENGHSVIEYDDIYQFDQIGVLQGASYFERFDQDITANKFEVTSQDQLFPMLLAGRLDAIAGYVPTVNYRIAVEGYGDQIDRSVFEYQEPAFVYITVSKKSPLAARFSEINQINNALIDEGFIDQVVTTYYEKYR